MIYAALALAMAAGLSACNAQKKNTAAARQYTGFITRYNILYNGDKHFSETLKDMEDKYEDDYSQMVLMHPVEAKADKKAPQPSGSFNRSIEKAQKAIQIRSIKKKPQKKSGKASDPAYKEWMKRDEYNPVLHRAWMLMGESQYYNGDFLGAASTFYYVSKHFTWLPDIVTEAKLWQALSYVSMDWLYEAEIIITRIKPEELTNKDIKELYNYTWANFQIKSKAYEKAVPYLNEAISYASGSQKTRLRFLLGQVYARMGDRTRAYEAFRKAGSSPSASYRTKFNARIKQSEVFAGVDITPEVKALKSMARLDRNAEYLDQIYYAIGNLYLSRGDTAQAMENYELAAEKSTRGGIDKALAQITLGTLYFGQGNYEKAQPCYSEAIPQLPETYPDYATLKRRSDVLDELAVYSQNVNLQDSLLHLASLPEEQQIEIIDKIIAELIRKEKEAAEEARREEYLAQQSAGGNQLTDKNQREFTINSDNSWYFYNDASKSSGKTEFQRRWGSRKLEDDWRRRNKTVFDMSDFDADSSSETEDAETAGEMAAETNDSIDQARKETDKLASDPHNREFYLKQIPVTDEEKAISNDIIQEGLYNMGVILKDKLEDYPAALAEFNRLLTDYPDNIYRLDAYYNLYLMCMRKGDSAGAERYRQLILSDFADSKYGMALRDPNYIEHLKKMDQVQEELYEQAFDDYMANRNPEVHAAFSRMEDTYPMSPLMPKFMFLDALAYVTEKKPDEFNAVLREMLDRYPTTDLAPTVSAWLKGMAQGRQLQTAADGTNMRGMLWDIHLSNDSTVMANDSIVGFEIDDMSPQMLVLVFPTDEISANALLYQVARHNFNSFVVKDFDLELMNFGRLGMLLVKGFDNLNELNHYRKVMSASEDFHLPQSVTPIPISTANFNTLLEQGRTFDDYFRFLQKHNYESPQLQLTDASEVETLEEAEAAEAAMIEAEEAEEAESEAVPDAVQPDDPAPVEPTVTVPATENTTVATPTPESKPEQTPAPASISKNTTPPAATPLPDGSEGEDDPLLQ
ncbi:MAG: tetratricopeptide repeat protein [Muribaculaceae bacterium]|nr:tetratricopeptide repeat protein [Muribaculaceae bacterium]